MAIYASKDILYGNLLFPYSERATSYILRAIKHILRIYRNFASMAPPQWFPFLLRLVILGGSSHLGYVIS